MGERVNASPLSAREGKVYIDGVLVADACKFTARFKPTVWSGKQLSERGTNRRWIGYDIELTLEQWKTTRMYRQMVDKYIDTGNTPEFTFQGIQEDKNCDFYEKNGAEEITCLGCVLTSEVNLIDMDTDGEVVKETATFGAKKIV